MEGRLFNLFTGDLTQYIEVTITGDLDPDRNKREAKYITVTKPVTEYLWREHLDGKKIIGIRPEFQDKCKWGCIDIDPQNYKDYSEKKYVDIIKNYNLPLVPVKSKSGGLHLFIFFNEWVDVKLVKQRLEEINKEYFLSKEIFPCNKAVGMPYTKMEFTTEYAYDDNNVPLMIGAFLDLAEQKKISLLDFKKFKIQEYEAESMWREYPPCVQKLIQEGINGKGSRNNYLFNVAVLEMKKSDNTLTLKTFKEMLRRRNSQIFNPPMDLNEVDSLAESVHKKQYNYRCPPKHGDMTPICNQHLCKQRKLGIMDEIPDIIDEFTNIFYSISPKDTFYEFDYQGQHIVTSPTDMDSESAWRRRLMKYKIYWITLPKSKKGPAPFELLMSGIVSRANEHKDLAQAEVNHEVKMAALRDFFDKNWEQSKIEDASKGYVIKLKNTNLVYFKQTTFYTWYKKNAVHLFDSAKEAMLFLNCKKIPYIDGVKNLWCVEDPFINEDEEHDKKQNGKNVLTEMDNEYHEKFRKPKTESTQEKNN